MYYYLKRILKLVEEHSSADVKQLLKEAFRIISIMEEAPEVGGIVQAARAVAEEARTPPEDEDDIQDGDMWQSHELNIAVGELVRIVEATFGKG